MKANYTLLAITAAIVLFSACEKWEKQEIRPTAGVWVEHLHPDGAERVLTFMDGVDAVDYSVAYFSPDISKEKISVPFSIDKKSDELRISFIGVENRMDISEIVINPKENRNIWYGIMNYSVPDKKPDTLYFSYAGLTYNEVLSKEAASIELPSDKDLGPVSYVSELPGLEWDNPIVNAYSSTDYEGKNEGSILAFIGEKIAASAGKQLGKMLFNVIWDSFFPPSDPMSKNIKSIMQDISIIKKQLEIIQKQLEEIKKELIRQNLNERNSVYIALSSSVSEIMLKIEGAIEGNKDHPADASAAIKELILEWGKETVNGNPIYNAVQNYVGVSIDHLYPNLYDTYARETFAWESDGYEWREMLRTTDEVLVSATSALTVMYYAARNSTQPTVITEATLKKEIDKQVELLRTMENKYAEWPVEHHPNFMICQISGLHRVFDKKVEWRDLEHPEWYPSSLEIWLSPQWLVFGTGQYDQTYSCKQRFMTESEYDKLVQYYSNKKNISLLRLFKEIGFDVVKTDDFDSSIACMLLPGIAIDIPAGGLGFERRGIHVDRIVTNKERAKVKDRGIGIVSANKVPIREDYRIKYEWRFDKYVKYYNYTWFNLQVLKRDID